MGRHLCWHYYRKLHGQLLKHFAPCPLDNQVPVDVGGARCTIITELLEVMLQWLGKHDLARFFREDVDFLKFPSYKRVSWRKIREKIPHTKQYIYFNIRLTIFLCVRTGRVGYILELSLPDTFVVFMSARIWQGYMPTLNRSRVTLGNIDSCTRFRTYA